MPARRAVRVVARRDADDDAGVGVELGAGILAHAVGGDAAGFRGGGDHAPAGAHAEAVDAAAVAGVVHQLVVGGAQHLDGRRRRRSGRGRSATGDARCGRRWRTAWPRWRRRGGAAWRRCRARCGRWPGRRASASICSPSARVRPRMWRLASSVDVLDARREAVFAAQGFDLGADALDDGDQAEGADMGFAGGQDFLGGAGFDELGQHLAGRGGGGP